MSGGGATMTGRERLDRRKRWFKAALLGTVGLFVLGIVLLHNVGDDVAVFVIAPAVAALVGLAVAGQMLAFRCPWCRASLGTLLMHGGVVRMDPKIRYCPYCGTAFDDEAPAAGGWADATAAQWDDPVE